MAVRATRIGNAARIIIERSGDLNAQDLSALIDSLSAIRADIRPRVLPSAPINAQVRAEIDPRWTILPVTVAQSRMLWIRQAGLGWIAFLLSDEAAAQLARGLLPPQPTPPPPPQPRQ